MQNTNRTILEPLFSRRRTALSALLALGLWIAAGFSPPAAAEVNQRINFQGRLIDPVTGNPKDGSFGATFRICDSPTGGCTGGSKLWEETQTISADNGVFEVALGANVAISSAVFGGSAQYLEIQVGNETLSPRQRLVAVPTALRAAMADRLEPGDPNYIQLRNTLQAGATFYVSSGTVAGPLRVTGNLDVDGVLTAGSGNEILTSAAGLIDATKLDANTLVPNASINGASITKEQQGWTREILTVGVHEELDEALFSRP